MNIRSALPLFLGIILAHISCIQAAGQPKNSVLLRNIKSLTLYKDRKTTHRRVNAVPQLSCVGGSGKGYYEIDVLRCTNSGSSYDEDNVDWTCKASLPPEFKLGSTDVICEGYSSSDDPYILKGSCGVEYRLILTDLGEEKYGSGSWFSKKPQKSQQETSNDSPSETFFNFIFWCLFVGVGLWIGYVFISSLFGNQQNGRRRRNNGPRPRGGGGGGWGSDDGNDPPPPYDPRPPRQTYSKPRSSPRASTSQEGSSSWNPGFFAGAATGAAAAYAATRGGRSRAEEQAHHQESSWLNWRGGSNQQRGSSWFNAGEGSSRSGGGSNSPSSSQAPSSARYESTGFGTTQRR